MSDLPHFGSPSTKQNRQVTKVWTLQLPQIFSMIKAKVPKGELSDLTPYLSLISLGAICCLMPTKHTCKG